MMDKTTDKTTDNTADRYSRVQRLPWRTLDGQTVIVDPRTREVHVLNGTGSQIWELLDRRRSVAELVTELQRDGEFDVDVAVLQAEVQAFLQELQRKQLLAEGEPPGEQARP